MSKRTTTQHIGSANFKDSNMTIAEMKRHTKNLVEYLEYHGRKNKWKYKILVVGSEVDGCLGEMVKVGKGRGRPKKEFKPYSCVTKKGIPWKTEPHIHFIIKANPGSQVVKELKNYWEKDICKGVGTFRTKPTDNGVNGKSYIPYMENQEAFRTERSMGYVGNWQ